MSTGAERIEAHGGAGWTGGEPETGESQDWAMAQEDAEEGPRRVWPRLLAAVLILLAGGWIGACAWVLARSAPEPDPAIFLGWAVTVSVPLILLGLVWLIFGRTGRRETEKFAAAVAALRRESEALNGVLAVVGERLADNRARVGEEAARLMTLGDEASDRLGRVTHYLARESAELDRRSLALEQAAENARVDLGVLMGDLPRAEEQARAAAESMKQAGLEALERAGSLEGQLSALLARGREADEIAAGAAQRLAAQLARIESNAGAAGGRIDEAATQMNAAVDGAMARAAAAVEESREAVSSQSAATLAMIEQSRAAFAQAGAEASERIAARLDQIGSAVEALGKRLAVQESETQSLLSNVGAQVAEVEERIAALSAAGEDTHGQLAGSIGGLRESVRQLGGEIEAGRGQAGDLVERTRSMADSIGAVARQLREELAGALTSVESQAMRTGEAAQAAVEPVEAIQSAAAMAADSVAESEASIQRQRESLDTLLENLRGGLAAAEERLRALGAATGETDAAAEKLVQQTGPALVEALVRVREAAGQAANHARDAIASAIPESAAALAEASRKAVGEAVSAPVREQLVNLAQISEAAVDAARTASERLTRQLLTIGETAAAVEARIGDDRAAREQAEAENLSRRVTLLIEALNSTAIDVTKILSNEVTDSAWAAYLKGDRGVFTRRAVRLLESGEAREILRHYEEEPEFREQVNRYVHDFEALLRRVLADPEGSALAITLLSSDMGKLYVALAQAIDRLRR